MADDRNLEWLADPSLQDLLRLLNADGGEARIAGGAVRNALLGHGVADIDIATTLVPRDVILRLKEEGIKAVPTGIEHGTVTAVIDGTSFEITTLREDIETDGRRARVLYGTDWEADACRRDLTINALYMEADGTVFDPLGGLRDLETRTIRFVGDAAQRIREDHLRILRFFRFFAWHGRHRPDAEGLKASARLKGELVNLSAERVWQELSKLLAAPDPGRALLWMRQTGVLNVILPESEKWGIDAVPGLIEAEGQYDWKADPLVRLMALLPPRLERIEPLAKRLKLPNVVRDRLIAWARAALPDAALSEEEFAKTLYRGDPKAIADRLKLAIAREDEHSDGYAKLLAFASRWEKPVFPLRGRDLLAQGMEPGPDVSRRLAALEAIWIDSGFALNGEALLASETNQPEEKPDER